VLTRVLAIGEKERAAIKAAIERAAKRPITKEMLAAFHVKDAGAHLTLEMRKQQFGADWDKRPKSEFVNLPVGYLAAISFEEQPIGLCRHLSISVDKPGALPNPAAVEMIMKEFGCDHLLAAPWIEEFEPGHEAINIVALSNPPTGKA
jgi:hypothetical protein